MFSWCLSRSTSSPPESITLCSESLHYTLKSLNFKYARFLREAGPVFKECYRGGSLKDGFKKYFDNELIRNLQICYETVLLYLVTKSLVVSPDQVGNSLYSCFSWRARVQTYYPSYRIPDGGAYLLFKLQPLNNLISVSRRLISGVCTSLIVPVREYTVQPGEGLSASVPSARTSDSTP